MTDKRTIDVYNAKAQDYAARFETEKPDKHLLKFMAGLREGGTVLDFGCGTGGATTHMVDAGFAVTGLDVSSEMLAIAQTRTKARFVEASFDDMTAKSEYDGVWANFSLLHAARDAVPRHLKAIHDALKPSGLFHIGVKTGTGSARDGIDRLYTYFETDELIGLLEAAGFEGFEIDHGEGAGLAGDVEAWVIVLSRRAD